MSDYPRALQAEWEERYPSTPQNKAQPKPKQREANASRQAEPTLAQLIYPHLRVNEGKPKR
jgi:hypothetical protein